MAGVMAGSVLTSRGLEEANAIRLAEVGLLPPPKHLVLSYQVGRGESGPVISYGGVDRCQHRRLDVVSLP